MTTSLTQVKEKQRNEHNYGKSEADNKEDHDTAQLSENQRLLVTQLWIRDRNWWIQSISLQLVQNARVPQPHY